MHFLIETKDQLSRLPKEDSCFLQVVPNSYLCHPKLTGACLYYYRNSEKGYIIAITHSETMSIEEKIAKSFIANHKKVYVLDRKFHSYFVEENNLVDLSYSILSEKGEVRLEDHKTDIQKNYEKKFESNSCVNQIIPVCKLYESLEFLYSQVQKYLDNANYSESLVNVDNAYKYVEQSPIGITEEFYDTYNIQNTSYSIQKNSIYTRYNLYNQTGRPTNTFNGINFLAIPKDKEHRECIVPLNDYLVEFDFDGYHIRLIAKEIGYELPTEPVHEFFGKMYFKKDQLTEEEYKNSKSITFKQLYGGVLEEYKDFEFFKKMQTYIDSLSLTDRVTLPTGISLKPGKDMSKIKLFNYIVQNLETKNNSEKILKLKKLLEGKKTKLVLITYDAFLFDFDKRDGKHLLLDIKSILEQGAFLTKHKYGKNYFL